MENKYVENLSAINVINGVVKLHFINESPKRSQGQNHHANPSNCQSNDSDLLENSLEPNHSLVMPI